MPSNTPPPRPNGKWIDVARRIADELAQDRVSPGEILDGEAELMTRYGVSRATLREALRLLQFLGLVEIKMGRSGGTMLREPTAEHLAPILTLYLQFAGCTWRQLHEAYAEIKPHIVAAAARNRTPEQAADLEALLAEHLTLPIREQAALLPALVQAYHAMSNNPMLSLIGRAFETVVLSQSAISDTSPESLPKVIETTRLLAQEIVNGNEARALRIAQRQGEAALALRQEHHPEQLDSVISWD